MAPKFVSNSISLGKASFADFAKKVVDASNAKLAASNSTVKTASTKVAELTDAQKKLPQALQDAIEAKGGSKKEDKDEKKDDKSDAKDEKKEDKKDDKKEKECKTASGSNEDGAPSSGQLKVEPLHQTGESTGSEKKTEKKDSKDEKKEDKEASTTTGFIRISKLNPANKAMLNKYYKTIYPPDFADALVADY